MIDQGVRWKLEDAVRGAIDKCKKYMENTHGHPPGTDDYVQDVLDALDLLELDGEVPWAAPPAMPKPQAVTPNPESVSKVLGALFKKPDVLYGVLVELWEKEIFIAGPWEREIHGSTRSYADTTWAAEVKAVRSGGPWEWRVTVPNEAQDFASGEAVSFRAACAEADAALLEFNVFFADPSLPEDAG
jgi:hypothetical protein